jgi:hypothetical protein
MVICPGCRSVCGSPVLNPTLDEQGKCHACDAILYTGISDSYYHTEATSRRPFKKAPKPKVIAPFVSLYDLLAEFLSRPGMEEKLDAWRLLPREGKKYRGVWDGKMWNTICDSNGDLFFGERDDSELRIAATCSLDW